MIDSLLSAPSDAEADKRLFHQDPSDPSHRQPRFINTGMATINSAAFQPSKTTERCADDLGFDLSNT